MLKKKMYVRCPADKESDTDPRIFMIGQIVEVDEFTETANVIYNDPFNYFCIYEDLRNTETRFSLNRVNRCSFYTGTKLISEGKTCTVIAKIHHQDDYDEYYLKDIETGKIFKSTEDNVIAPFISGRISPRIQLKQYEFQNPVWYLGHAVVDKSTHILENSIFGFKELAGCKIYLLPHQVSTIMRCLQSEHCRYMLADEVGMGKTIEALSILKIYLLNRSEQAVLILTPPSLREQWKTEIFFKFNMIDGVNPKHNLIRILSTDELNDDIYRSKWDFLIVDEIHRFIDNPNLKRQLQNLSANTENVLLLSATPVQQRKEEYLELLRLLNPKRYLKTTQNEFESLLEKQNKLIVKATLLLDDLNDYENVQRDCREKGESFLDNEDHDDLSEEMNDYIEEICELLQDHKLANLFKQINFSSEDGGIFQIKVFLSYVCSNYQIENNVIRNRRAMLENSESGIKMPTRQLKELVYELDPDRNEYEALTYRDLCNWIHSISYNEDVVREQFMPLLTALFSSSFAFEKVASVIKGIPAQLLDDAKEWTYEETRILTNIQNIIDDPYSNENYYNSRPVMILNYLYEEIVDSKAVLFTEYNETFEYYKNILETIYNPSEIAYFCSDMSTNELEDNAYKFQNSKSCQIMLCDRTGGEGRNFQCADYVVHIDLPWDANAIEQRIGRLDRLERDPSRNTVTSIVVHSNDTFENDLFRFWNEGLCIFTRSLSGMEIIMNDISKDIYSSFGGNFQFELANAIPNIISRTQEMRDAIIKEQNFDVAASMFKPTHDRLQSMIRYYNENENVLFTNAMQSWASLAGFHGSYHDDLITYYPTSFSVKSAKNTLLIPPDWSEYLDNKQILLSNSVRSHFDKKFDQNSLSIEGTFSRKRAIENDYLHFFAPGDPIFDCIVDNAIHSCKGQAAAFAVKTDINWSGFIYTLSIVPDEAMLLDHGISIYALNQYRSYISSNVIITPVTLCGEATNEEVIRAYNSFTSNYKRKDIEHLGSRGESSSFAIIGSHKVNNIEYFKYLYPKEQWENLVDKSWDVARKKAKQELENTSYIEDCSREMERNLSAQEASDLYYGKTTDLENEKIRLGVILDSLKNAKLRLDSAAFILMKK